MRNNRFLGSIGEDFAKQYLIKQGYKIIETNFSKRYGEIDLIAIHPSTSSGQATLVFIEVKTRTSTQFGTPLEAITPWKLRAVVRSAEYYKLTHKNLPDAMRIDAVSVIVSPDGTLQTIEHIKNISGF